MATMTSLGLKEGHFINVTSLCIFNGVSLVVCTNKLHYLYS